jgi:glucose-1-phosphate cytidylyltransferase
MKLYAHHGLRDFVLCLGYRGDMIKEYFLNYEAMTNDFTIRLGQEQQISYHEIHQEQDFRVTLAETGLESMTGARVKRVERYVDDDLFLVTYGDGVSDVNIRDLLRFHKSHGRMATVTTVRPTSRFGLLNLEVDARVNSFAEKPQVDGWISAGYFVFDRRFFDYLSPDPACILERAPLEQLTHDGQLMAYRHEGFFYAMDTYREYIYLNELWNSGHAPWAVWDQSHE